MCSECILAEVEFLVKMQLYMYLLISLNEVPASNSILKVYSSSHLCQSNSTMHCILSGSSFIMVLN